MNNLNINITSLSFKCSAEEGENFIKNYHDREGLELLGGKYLIREISIKKESSSYLGQLNTQKFYSYEDVASVEMDLFKVEGNL